VSAAIGWKLTSEAAPPSLPEEFTDSFQRVYTDHFALVFRGLRRLGVTPSSVEDAVQDVFLVVHRRLHDFEGKSELRTWVYGIVVRVAKDYRRAEARRSRRVQRYAELNVAEANLLPSERAERREAHRLLHRALADLGDEERALFVLVELEELSVREAASALNLEVRTCQRRLKSAREKFEARISELVHTCQRAEP